MEPDGAATRRVTGDLLCHLIEVVLYKVHTLFSDSGADFTELDSLASASFTIEKALAASETFQAHSFESAWARSAIDYRVTKSPPPGRTDRSRE